MFKIFMIAFVAVLFLQSCGQQAATPATSTDNSTMPGTIAADAQ